MNAVCHMLRSERVQWIENAPDSTFAMTPSHVSTPGSNFL
jgi:hypothetical protein